MLEITAELIDAVTVGGFDPQEECSRVLRDAGAKRVWALTIAR